MKKRRLVGLWAMMLCSCFPPDDQSVVQPPGTPGMDPNTIPGCVPTSGQEGVPVCGVRGDDSLCAGGPPGFPYRCDNICGTISGCQSTPDCCPSFCPSGPPNDCEATGTLPDGTNGTCDFPPQYGVEKPYLGSKACGSKYTDADRNCCGGADEGILDGLDCGTNGLCAKTSTSYCCTQICPNYTDLQCDGACVDPMSNDNCGHCGVKCPANTQCQPRVPRYECIPSCPPDTATCTNPDGSISCPPCELNPAGSCDFTQCQGGGGGGGA